MSQKLYVKEKETYSVPGLQTTSKTFPNSLKMSTVTLGYSYFSVLSFILSHITNVLQRYYSTSMIPTNVPGRQQGYQDDIQHHQK